MHLANVFGGVVFGRQVRLDGLVHEGDESDQVSKGHIWRRPNAINLVLFGTRVPQSNFVLIVSDRVA
jgi:hypothetical protein